MFTSLLIFAGRVVTFRRISFNMVVVFTNPNDQQQYNCSESSKAIAYLKDQGYEERTTIKGTKMPMPEYSDSPYVRIPK